MADDDQNNDDILPRLGKWLMHAFGMAADGNDSKADSAFSFEKILPEIMLLFGFTADKNPIAKVSELAEHAGSAVKQAAESTGRKIADTGRQIADSAEHLVGYHDNNRFIAVVGDSLAEGEESELQKHFKNVSKLTKVGADINFIDDKLIAQVPQGAAVIMNMGINHIDKHAPMGAKAVGDYASEVVGRAAQIKAERGADVALNNIAVRDADPVYAANIKAVNDAIKLQADQRHIPITDITGVSDWANTLHKTNAGYDQMASLGLKTLGLTG